jgi:hypothetical protein
VSTCLDCGRQWTGRAEAHCASCCNHFTSDGAFDRHLASVRSDDDCYPPETFRKRDGSPLFEQIQRKYGLVWRLVRADSNPFAMFGQHQEPRTGGEAK